MSATQDPRLVVPLQSDPRWIGLGVVGVLVASNALFVWLFAGSRLHPALGLLPGMTLAVFAGSVLAAWGRRRGGTLALEANAFHVALRDDAGRHEVLDLNAPFAAVLLRGRDDGRRLLVLAQRDEPTVVLERNGVAPAPDAPAGPWRPRAPETDLAHAAISPASARVVALAANASLDPLLGRLGDAVEAGAPWFQHPTPGGPPLIVDGSAITLGTRVVPISAELKVLDYAVGPKGAAVAALGVAGDEGALLLVGCEEAPLIPGAVATDLVPDAFLPVTGFEVLRAVIAAAVSECARGRRG